MKHFTDRPCAAPGLVSYRYRGAYGWIMIGAKDISDALREANRSLSYDQATPDRLEIWNAEAGAYEPAVMPLS